MIDPLGRLAARAPASFNWSLHGVQLSARIRAAGDSEFGGDWCEAFPVSQGVIALSIGDVRGHGEEKYATMVAMRGALRAAALCGLDPAQALAEAHDFLRVYDPEDFATAILAFLHVARRRVSFAIAGHPPPLHCSATGAVYLDAGSYDVPLGIPSGAPPVRHDVQLSCASLLVFYTDGVTERARQPHNGQAELPTRACTPTPPPARTPRGSSSSRCNLRGPMATMWPF